MRYGHGHGSGAKGNIAVVETQPASELPYPPQALPPVENPAMLPGQDSVTGRFVKGNKLQQRKLPGLLFSIGGAVRHQNSPDDLRQFLRWGRKWAKARRMELANMCGGQIGAGVIAMVESAALALSQARYLSYLAGNAASDPDPRRGESAMELMTRSVAMSDKARVSDITAYELAIRECKARPQNTPNELLLQGLATSDNRG